jgi:hypothetical protein
MTGPQRKQRTPTISKPVGSEFISVDDFKTKEAQRQVNHKIPKYVSKKKVICLPAPKEEN